MKNNFSLLYFLFVAFACSGQDLDFCSIVNERFQGGETLSYRMYYNWSFVWIPAGEVTFQINENDDTYEVTVQGKTYPSYDHFFKVDDYFYSRFDRKTLLPQQFTRRIQEGSYEKYDSINFDQDNHRAYGIIGTSRKEALPYNEEIRDCTHDVLSILYHTRNVEFQKSIEGKEIPVEVFFDTETYDVALEYAGIHEEKEIKNLGKFSTLKLIPEMVAGEVFDENSKMTIWVSNDQNRIPLLIESPVSIGSVKAVLLDYDGLKYPLEKER